MNNKIAVRLAKQGLFFAIVIGLITGVMQIIYDYSDEIERNNKFIENVLLASSASPIEAAFQMDKRLADDAIQALLTYDFIIMARIVNETDVIHSEYFREPPSRRLDGFVSIFGDLQATYEIELIEPKSQLHVGKLMIVVHNPTIMREFYWRSLRVIVTGVLRNILFAFVLLALFVTKLNRPLEALITQLRRVNPREPSPIALPESIKRAENEITEVGYSVNRILDASWEHLRELEQARKKADKISLQLRHTERLGAIGQLTGGVAHDFNNILAIILGSLELVRHRSKPDEILSLVDDAIAATQRGANLTSQLLAYSRKQPLDPSAIRAKDIIFGLETLLNRALGEQIELEFIVTNDVWLCFADRQRLETVILNLAINSRHAMPGGGELMIEAFNSQLDLAYCQEEDDQDIEPGDYVCIAVTDNGGGMTSEVMAHAFEPFFSTKKSEKGSGLGLSMAYGFAKQSRGHIKIYSEEGQGTTIKLYLPRSRPGLDVDGQSECVEDKGAPDLSGKKIFVTEDNIGIQKIISGHLELMGAQVIVARNGVEALKVLAGEEDIAAFLLDVILPGKMNGRELAGRIKRIYPDAQIAFLSGYTENAIIHNARLDEGVIFLQKPFSREGLVLVLNRLLKTK